MWVESSTDGRIQVGKMWGKSSTEDRILRVPRRHPDKALTAIHVRQIKKPGRYSDGKPDLLTRRDWKRAVPPSEQQYATSTTNVSLDSGCEFGGCDPPGSHTSSTTVVGEPVAGPARTASFTVSPGVMWWNVISPRRVIDGGSAMGRTSSRSGVDRRH